MSILLLYEVVVLCDDHLTYNVKKKIFFWFEFEREKPLFRIFGAFSLG